MQLAIVELRRFDALKHEIIFEDWYKLYGMRWVEKYQLFLFDFDGLLVNSEPLHYEAYLTALERRGVKIGWSFANFCELAHLNDRALREAICERSPEIGEDWPRFYAEKRGAYEELLAGAGTVALMPGVEALLQTLEAKGIRRAVATNSPRLQMEMFKSRLPVLNSIPHWITREDYSRPKPDPECYLLAIARLGKAGDRIIGFEDSVRGLEALKKTPALPVLICPAHHPLLEMAMEGGGRHYESLQEIPDSGP